LSAATLQVRLSWAIREALGYRRIDDIPTDERKAAAEILRAYAHDLDPQ
jgi:regulator of protease activity HflC (stomatin/prohibitin superfamily)